jgi:hypothetical protein
MPHELSHRARRHLERRTRGEYVADLGLVRAALERAGAPVTDPVLDFHRTFAGYQTWAWGDSGPLGIIHRTVQEQSWYEPMEVGGYVEEGFLACADIHLSWEMMIQTDGTFHCNGPEGSSYFLCFEAEAYLNEYIDTHRARRVPPDGAADELNDRLVPVVAPHLVADLSDQYQQLYATDRWAVLVGHGGGRHDIWLATPDVPAELAPFVGPGRPKTYPELEADLRSTYSSRRYRAICQIHDTTDPAAAPLFRLAATDETEQTALTAVAGLGRLKDREAIPILDRVVRSDGRESVVRGAIHALAAIGGAETFPALVAATHLPDATHRRDAAIALGRIGDRTVLPALEAIRSDAEKVTKYTGLCPSNLDDPAGKYATEAIKAITKRHRA